ncbi:metal-sensing transcriptional repressor [Proteiniclasticum sp. SCR006]|uniref:Metal-sensing transcriptional repressor n=2 Tax=Proteiniclasticum aestuarii TaxID=2817862 RepID=A0A939HA98_9CLOT|nr:metal-sensing transcriptional repressor [Proteiniclasticum aestuarii]
MNRLSRTEGQIRGITKMIEEDRDCREIVIQLAAVRAGVDRVINLIVTENLMSCVLSDTDEIDKKQLEEALELIFKLK